MSISHVAVFGQFNSKTPGKARKRAQWPELQLLNHSVWVFCSMFTFGLLFYKNCKMLAFCFVVGLCLHAMFYSLIIRFLENNRHKLFNVGKANKMRPISFGLIPWITLSDIIEMRRAVTTLVNSCSTPVKTWSSEAPGSKSAGLVLRVTKTVSFDCWQEKETQSSSSLKWSWWLMKEKLGNIIQMREPAQSWKCLLASAAASSTLFGHVPLHRTFFH